ncbi:retrotransposon protein, putative, ty1-copia subclass [Tanacetum coccineum]
MLEQEEYDDLMKNRTWSLVPRASNTNVVDGKWVYMLKRDKNGVITRYKARFIAKGFRQQPGIDFHETFSPVVKSATIRAVLSLAVTNDWPLRQLDIQNAFLHGNLKEQSIFTSPISSPSSVSHLSPTSQTSPESSNGQPSPVSTTSIPTPPPPPPITRQRPANLRQNPKQRVPFNPSANHALPGIQIKCYKNGAITRYKARFVAKGFRQQLDLGPLNYFLGIEIVPHVSDILLSQKKYILELLQSAGLSNCNLVSSPMVTSSSLSLDDSTAFSNPVKYRQVVGSLQYVTLSRPDIAFAVNKALANTVVELTWLQALLNELGIHSSSTPILWCDNLCATYLSANPIIHARIKHVDIDYHFVREKVSQGDLRVQHISTHDQIADIFTNPLPTSRFLFLRSKLQVVSRP